MVSPRYPSPGEKHVLLNRSCSGDRVMLEDRSLWRIDPGEAVRARRWPQWTRVEVKAASAHAYWLIAEVLGQRETVLAVYGGRVPAARVPTSPVAEGEL